jgi:DNA polymerase beta
MSNKSSNLSKLSNTSNKSNKTNSLKRNKTNKVKKTVKFKNSDSKKMSKTQKKTIKNKKKQAIKKVIIVMEDDSNETTYNPEISQKIPISESEKIETDLKISPLNNISNIPMDIPIETPIEKETIINNVSNVTNSRWNEKFIDLMEKLAEIMLKQGEPFRARAYQKAQETIMAFPHDIKSPDDLKGLPGIGDTIMEKLKEYVNTGTLRILEREKNNPVNILTDVYGIGPKKAKELVEKQGIKSIEDLRKNKQLLNDIQIVGLDNYEDVLKRIPRSEIDEFDKYFKGAFVIASSADSNADYEIVGSYRRGAENSGDIDVIITSDKPEVFKKFIDKLISDKIITHVLSRGPTKCLVIAKLPGEDSIARRVDFLYSNKEEYPFSVLYFTGSKIFNTVMRHQALTMGYTMNEHGMYKMEGKKKGEKVDHLFKNEKDIFDFLNMDYKEPKERKDGRSVVIKGSQPKTNKVVEEISEKKETIINNIAIPTPIPISTIQIPALESKVDDALSPDEIVIVKKEKTKKVKKQKSLKNKEKILENIKKITEDEMKKISENNKTNKEKIILIIIQKLEIQDLLVKFKGMLEYFLQR